MRRVFDWKYFLQLLEQSALIASQFLWNLDVEVNEKIASGATVQLRYSETTQAELSSRLCTFGNLNSLRPIEGFDLDLCS